MPAFLLSHDSSKSPAVAKTDITSENMRINAVKITKFIFMCGFMGVFTREFKVNSPVF
jgi:hypothetical protein